MIKPATKTINNVWDNYVWDFMNTIAGPSELRFCTNQIPPPPLAPPPVLSVFVPNSNQSVPIVYTLVWISHNECRRSFLLFLRMLCHLLIAKRTIEHIRRGKSYFKLFFGFFCYIYFLVLDLLCRRESTDVFFISARNLFSSFLYNLDVFGEILKSNIWYRCVLWRTCMLFVLP